MHAVLQAKPCLFLRASRHPHCDCHYREKHNYGWDHDSTSRKTVVGNPAPCIAVYISKSTVMDEWTDTSLSPSRGAGSHHDFMTHDWELWNHDFRLQERQWQVVHSSLIINAAHGSSVVCVRLHLYKYTHHLLLYMCLPVPSWQELPQIFFTCAQKEVHVPRLHGWDRDAFEAFVPEQGRLLSL